MKYELPVYSDGIRKSTQTRFMGLNHNPGAGDGEIYEMRNLCSDWYPLLATRNLRRMTAEATIPAGAYGLYADGDKLVWVDDTTLYYDGEMVDSFMLQDIDKERVFASIKGKLVIMPDKIVYDPKTDTAEDIEKSFHGAVNFTDGTLYDVAASANTISVSGMDWSEYFREGDAVTITGCSVKRNNITAVIREIDGDELHFYENSFTNANNKTVTITRRAPVLKYMFECENRIWGCDDSTVYCCKLGDPFNWFCYDGLDTDSWTVETSSSGNFTGAICFLGYPTFFKNRNIYKVYGNVPSNFEIMGSATLGVAAGSGRSLAVAGEALFYLSDNGICMYTGGLPVVIGRAFGQQRYKNAVGGSDGLKYYVCMQEKGESGDDGWHLYVYDTQRGMWHEEDKDYGHMVSFAWAAGELYYLTSIGLLQQVGDSRKPHTWWESGFTPGEGSWKKEWWDGLSERAFTWYAEFTDFTDESPNKKGISKIQIRLELDPIIKRQGEEDSGENTASVTVSLQMDSTGEWIVPEGGQITDTGKRSYTLAIIPQRADHYRMRIEGYGGCRIYSITREYYIGSELKSQPGRQ